MAYDSVQRQVMLFGGQSLGIQNGMPTNVQHNDTWEWNGSAWVMQTPSTGPSERSFQALANDSDRQRVVLFGGAAGPVDSNETWEWDGNQWTQLHPVHSPPGRHHHAMAYDAARKKVVLFGGFSSSLPPPNTRDDLSDTWVWDGTDWTQMHPATSPPPLAGISMAYNTFLGTVVLFGGAKDVGGPTTYSNDTWEWDGQIWTKVALATPLPAPRAGLAATYNEVLRVVVLFGGLGLDTSGNQQYFDDTYAGPLFIPLFVPTPEWALTTFNQSPDPRYAHAMAYSPVTDSIILFGGVSATNGTPNIFGDTWELRKNVLRRRLPSR